MSIKWLTIFLSIGILLLVLELVRRDKLTFKYACGWLLVSFAGVLFTLFDALLFKVAQFFGFTLTSNFIFFSLLGIFVFLSLLMTVFLCQQNSRNDTMAQKLGILEMELKQLKEKSDDEKR